MKFVLSGLRIITVFKEKMMGRVLGMCFHREVLHCKHEDLSSHLKHPCLKKQVPSGLGPVIVVLGSGDSSAPEAWQPALAESRAPAPARDLPQNIRWKAIEDDAREQLLFSICMRTHRHTGAYKHEHSIYVNRDEKCRWRSQIPGIESMLARLKTFH